MKIKIDNKNRAKIEAALEGIQGRCKTRTITVDDIYRYGKKFMAHLDALEIKVKDRQGARITIDNYAQKFPKAYGWTPESTQFTLEYCSSGLFLTDIERGRCTPRSFFISYTPKQKDVILQSMQKTLL